MGAEDSGLRRLQRETCDELVRLPMAEGVESLNVASAAAVALYEIARGAAGPRRLPCPTPAARRACGREGRTMASDAAEAIIEARRSQRILAPLGAIAPKTTEAGYAVQKEVALRLGGLPPAGFKIGATTKQMQAISACPARPAASCPGPGCAPRPPACAIADYVDPGVRMRGRAAAARDIPPGPCTRDQAAEAVGEVFAAMEIVDQRYGDLAVLGTPTLIADQVFHAGGVPGAPVAGWRALDLAATRGRIGVDGHVAARAWAPTCSAIPSRRWPGLPPRPARRPSAGCARGRWCSWGR